MGIDKILSRGMMLVRGEVMVVVILAIAGSVLFARERYKYWKADRQLHTAERIKLILKSTGAGVGMLSILALILFIASSYWW